MDNHRSQNLQINPDNDDDDYGSYFLQPTSSPYNMAEKVQQANMDLFIHAETEPLGIFKPSKVTFKEQLTTYEHELTDDEIDSIESEANNSSSEIQAVQPSSTSNVNALRLNIFDINEEGEEILDEIVEDIELEDDEIQSQRVAQPNDENILNDDGVESTQSSIESTKLSKIRKKIRKDFSQHSNQCRLDVVNCRNHCIEKFDFDLSMSIRKLEIHEKLPNLPLLKLQPRKCCDENKARNSVNLPTYNGMASEYGLSSTALERREKRKEIIRLKEEKRQQLVDEYKNRKNQQNEEVFCQWLKDVARRKRQKIDRWNSKKKSGSADMCGTKQPLSPNVINFPTKASEKTKGTIRPKTANEFVPKHNVKRARRIRPHTSPACVFIEVPQRLLKRGIHIGDLLVTNSNLTAKKLHIMSLSS